MWLCVVVWLAGLLAQAMPEGIVLYKLCGEKTCKTYEYCYDSTCQNCSHACTPPTGGSSAHNFDAALCEKNCQDYIHDRVIHYITYAESQEIQRDIRSEMLDTIDGLRTMVVFSLTLSLLVGVAMAAGLGFAWLRYRRMKKVSCREKDMMGKKIPTVSGNVNNNDCGGLRINMPSTGAPSVVTTTTPVSTRHPSEDITLEKHAYDNAAMTPSPDLTDNRGDTNF